MNTQLCKLHISVGFQSSAYCMCTVCVDVDVRMWVHAPGLAVLILPHCKFHN